MRFVPAELEGVIIVEPDVHSDARGFFLESYHERKYREGGIAETFVQDNHSRSLQGTLRGLHFQRRRPQGKLIRVVVGRVFDVAVDVRRDSPTFREWLGVELSAESFRQIYIPPGFLHGFLVLSDVAEVQYKATDFYDPSDELGVIWNDPDLGIAWPTRSPILSAKDRALPRLAEIESRLS